MAGQLARATPLDAPDGSALSTVRGRTQVIAAGGVAVVLDYAYPNRLKVDPQGAIDLTLPAGIEGLWYRIANFADAAESITVKNAAGSTVETCDQNEVLEVEYSGGAWIVCEICTATIT